MKRAVIAVTAGGVRLALALGNQMDCDIYTIEKLADHERLKAMHTSLGIFMGQVFEAYREVVMIMACGIAVRSIAPYVQSKLKDPAVVVMDEKGQHVISLISGHVGGANRLAKEIAALTGGQAVITTASDNLGLEAVDTLAERLGMIVDDFEAAKRVTACLVNGQKVCLISDKRLENLPEGITGTSWDLLSSEKAEALIYIGHKAMLPESDFMRPVVKLIPRDLVLGVGCRKGTDSEKVKRMLEALLHGLNLSEKAVCAIGTIGLKKEEPALLNLAAALAVPLEIVSEEAVAACEHLFERSDFVKKTTGLGAVCQPAAYLVSGKGKCLLPKTKQEGVTMSIYEITENGETKDER